MVLCTKIEQQLEKYDKFLFTYENQKKCEQVLSVKIAARLVKNLFAFFESFT